MKVHIELDMTPEEARAVMGLPDVRPLQEEMMAEMKARAAEAMKAGDLESLMRAFTPKAGRESLEQFQKFLWDSAKLMTPGMKDKS